MLFCVITSQESRTIVTHTIKHYSDGEAVIFVSTPETRPSCLNSLVLLTVSWDKSVHLRYWWSPAQINRKFRSQQGHSLQKERSAKMITTRNNRTDLLHFAVIQTQVKRFNPCSR